MALKYLLNLRRTGFFLLLSLWTFSLAGQDFDPVIRKTWENNNQLQAKNFSLEAAQHSLEEAKSLFGPKISFGAQYTLAAGGRDIDFPIGDLLNPVYSALNEITESQDFPQLENQEIYFLPNNFLDARIRIQQPIYNPDLAINRELKEHEIRSQELDVRAFKRTLSKDVMLGVFNYQKAVTAEKIYAQAENQLEEALRATSSLVRNGVSLPADRKRIEAEMSKVQAQHIHARTQIANAKRYLDFIVGEPLSTDDLDQIILPEFPPTEFDQSAVREELQKLDKAVDMTALAIERQDQFYHPSIGVQLDLGSQDFDFKLNPYALVGLNLEINLYDHKAHRHKKAQARAQMSSLQTEKQYYREQIQLQEDIARNNLQASIEEAKTFEARIESAKSLFQDALKRQKAGTVNTLDVIDAQTQVTQSELEYALARYDAWTRWAEYLYVTAGYTIE